MDTLAHTPHTVFMTGVTGLLGSYLLRDLVLSGRSVAVLVRRSRKQSPRSRIESMVSQWEAEVGRVLRRPRVFEGDITLPRCGLDDDAIGWVRLNCDTLLNNAASLTFDGTGPDQEPWRSNVNGVRHLLDLADRSAVGRLHHVSTAYVCGLRSGVIREDEIDETGTFANDYERSKAIGERLIREAKHLESFTIYRPSIIVGDSRSGFTSTYHGFFAALRLAHTLVRSVPLGATNSEALLGFLGIQPHWHKNFVPVDWVARAIGRLLGRDDAQGQTFHLTHPAPVPMSLVGSVIQEAVERFSETASGNDAQGRSESWFATNFRSELDIYTKYFRDDPVFDRSNVLSMIGADDVPLIDRASLLRMSEYAITNGFRSVPSHMAATRPCGPASACDPAGRDTGNGAPPERGWAEDAEKSGNAVDRRAFR
jgi:thioester reductase-like protein